MPQLRQHQRLQLSKTEGLAGLRPSDDRTIIERVTRQSLTKAVYARSRSPRSSTGASLFVGGGFYVLAFVVVLTVARTMASCWSLLTALE